MRKANAEIELVVAKLEADLGRLQNDFDESQASLEKTRKEKTDTMELLKKVEDSSKSAMSEREHMEKQTKEAELKVEQLQYSEKALRDEIADLQQNIAAIEQFAKSMEEKASISEQKLRRAEDVMADPDLYSVLIKKADKIRAHMDPSAAPVASFQSLLDSVNAAHEQMGDHVESYVGETYSPLVVAALSYGMMLIPCLCSAWVLCTIWSFITMRRFVLLCHFYWFTLSMCLYCLAYTMGLEPMVTFRDYNEGMFMFGQAILVILYLWYMLLLGIEGSACKTSATAEWGYHSSRKSWVMQVALVFFVGWHYSSSVLVPGFLEEPLKIQSSTYVLYCSLFLLTLIAKASGDVVRQEKRMMEWDIEAARGGASFGKGD
eukprot:Rmarinus@m.19375